MAASPITEAVKAAVAERVAAEQAKQQQRVTAARAKVAELLGSHGNPAGYQASYVEGSVVLTDGTVHLAVDPQDGIWLVTESDGEWTRQARVESLLDLAAPLEVA